MDHKHQHQHRAEPHHHHHSLNHQTTEQYHHRHQSSHHHHHHQNGHKHQHHDHDNENGRPKSASRELHSTSHPERVQHVSRPSGSTRKSTSASQLQARSTSTKQLRSASQAQPRPSSTKHVNGSKQLHTASKRSISRQVRTKPASHPSTRNVANPMRPRRTTLPLPSGNAGLWFEGSPAILTDVSTGSRIRNAAQRNVGQAITAMKIPGEIEIFGKISTEDLVELLNEYSNVEGRSLAFGTVAAAEKMSDVVRRIYLPSDKSCQILFSGKYPNVKVAKVEGDSRIKKKVLVGQIVRRLEFQGESPYLASVGAQTLNVLLQHHERTRGKILVVGSTSSSGSTSSRNNKSADELGLEEEMLTKSAFSTRSIRQSFKDWKIAQ